MTDNGRKPLVKSKKDNVGVEINVTEEDVKTAIKSISVLFAVVSKPCRHARPFDMILAALITPLFYRQKRLACSSQLFQGQGELTWPP